jgi:hypothetical protein
LFTNSPSHHEGHEDHEAGREEAPVPTLPAKTPARRFAEAWGEIQHAHPHCFFVRFMPFMVKNPG